MKLKKPIKHLRVILGDQISRSVSSLSGVNSEEDVVLLMEVHDEASYVKHHKQKIVFFLSAMRHFARELEEEGLQVRYVRLDDPANTGSFDGEVGRAILALRPDRLVVTEASEWRVSEAISEWSSRFGLPVDVLEDDRFLCSRIEFAEWVQGRKQLRMEYFYRVMRRKWGWLMEGDQPMGGKWNFDADNRKSLPKDVSIPERLIAEPDTETKAVLKLVSEKFEDHFGDLDEYGWAVTREDAMKVLAFFVEYSLPRFGDYQDAMKSGEPFLYHSVISPYLNVGLLNPKEVCEAALDAYDNGHVEINAVEGFVRQILGWREYVRGIYWTYMPEYSESNYFGAKNKLPEFFWDGKTELNCLHQVVADTKRTAYAHHIQRLMVTGNFALLAGITPAEIEEWYLIVYADALDWVELPNVHGMVLHADGGILGSKPYAASGAYINRMSDYCRECKFSPKEKLGEQACPFNYLYWNFLIQNEETLGGNPRMQMPYRNLRRMPDERREEIVRQSNHFLREHQIMVSE